MFTITTKYHLNFTFGMPYLCTYQCYLGEGGKGGDFDCFCCPGDACLEAGGAHAPPRSQKGPPEWDHKIFTMIQNNVLMEGLTISMHFQKFEDLQLHFFPRGSMPLDS